MSNRLKPRAARPVRPWLATLTSGGDAPPLTPGPGMVDFGDGVIFDPLANRLLIELGGGTVLTLTPARKLAETLAQGFTSVSERPAHGRETVPCPNCGQPTLAVGTDSGPIRLDTDPSPNGVWVLRGEFHARMIQPLETPTAPTYAIHHCTGGTT